MTPSMITRVTTAGRRRVSMRPNRWDIAGIPAIVFMILLFVVPFGVLVYDSLTQPSPDNYSQVFGSSVYLLIIWHTIEVSVLVTIACAVIGYPVAYALAATRGVWRLLIAISLLLPLCTSLLVRGYAIYLMLAVNGPVNSALTSAHIIHQPLQLLFNQFSVVYALTNILVPFQILPIYAELRRQDPDLRLAASSLGARPFTVFRRVTLPLTRNGLIAGALIVFVLALGFYVIPGLVGGTSGTLISQLIDQEVDQYLQLGLGAALSIVLLVMVGIFLIVVSRFVNLREALGLARRDEP
jgi:putative spermidine/putrescine transport system permease protein